jgi:hypothetical protein
MENEKLENEVRALREAVSTLQAEVTKLKADIIVAAKHQGFDWNKIIIVRPAAVPIEKRT